VTRILKFSLKRMDQFEDEVFSQQCESCQEFADCSHNDEIDLEIPIISLQILLLIVSTIVIIIFVNLFIRIKKMIA
jgi:hypothetical protein